MRYSEITEAPSTADTMRLMQGALLDQRAEELAKEKGWTTLQARRFLQDKAIIDRRSGQDRRAVRRDGPDRRAGY